MKYLCLIYSDEKKRDALPREEMEAIKRKFFAYTDSIKKSGHYLGGEALEPTQTAKTVRSRDGKVVSTDGPFVETKEQLGGFYLIDAKDFDEAVQVASRIPSASFGSIEVRPVRVFDRE